jgi:uncharacterized repeat protein (TIGR01451 family)
MEATTQKIRRPHRFRRLIAKVGVVGVIASGAVLATAVSASADAPDVSTTTGTIVGTPDLANGTVTLQVSGDWAWPTHKDKNCNTDRWAAGWAVDWNDAQQAGNPVATLNSIPIDVGVLTGNSNNPTDNLVHTPTDAPRCGVYGVHGAISYNTGTWGPLDHVYYIGHAPATSEEMTSFINSLTPCAVTYDVHGQGANPSPDNPAKELKAGGTMHNGDNSVEKNAQTPAGNVCAQIDIVIPNPDVSIEKTGPAQVTAGDNITYTLTVTNTGDVATNATVLDEVPAGTTFVSASAECAPDEEDAGTIICTIPTLDPGDDLDVTITVATTEPGQVCNTGIVTPDDDTPGDNTSTWCTDVMANPNPDVAVVKTGPTTATVGTPYTYDITASNTGDVAADDVTVTDVIPTNTTFDSATTPCTYDSTDRTVTCELGTLAVGGSATVHITVTPTGPAGTAIVNTAVVTPDDETPGDNTSTWTIDGVNVLAAEVIKPVAPPTPTPAAAIAVAPNFTG